MERAVNVPGGCGEALRIRLRSHERPASGWIRVLVAPCAALTLVAATAATALAQSATPLPPGRPPADNPATVPSKPSTQPAARSRQNPASQPPSRKAALPAP